ncbi:MAG: serine/threonine-protein kinase [Polyangiaceae bacterium]
MEKNTLGKYRLLAELGRGGMSMVYLALVKGPAGFNKLVVLKMIRAQFSEEPEFVTMFLDEARLAARLNHPNIVQTNEVGQEDADYFMAMEYLEGQTLNRILNKASSKLSLSMNLRAISESLSGLHYAHELKDFNGQPLGVVHRDISPHNIFVTYEGQVKLVDFGIAKALNSSSETKTGIVKGKVAYMAPEQAMGERVDRRADLFSMGVVLWQMVAGYRMFRGLNDVAIIQKLMTGQIPSIREAVPDVDPTLEAIITKSLAPKREDRYSTAAEMRGDIEGFLDKLSDRRGLRELGAMITDFFADDRAKVGKIVEEQIAFEDQAMDLPFIDLPTNTIDSASSKLTPLSRTGTNSSARLSLGSTGMTGPQQIGAPPASSSNPNLQITTGTGSGTHIATVVPMGPSSIGQPAQRSKLPLFAGVAAVVGGVAAVLYFVVLAPKAPAPPASAGATATSTTSAATSFNLRIETNPSGATVRDGEVVLGATPLVLPVKAGAAGREFTIVKDGFETYKLTAPALTADLQLQAALTPVKATTAVADATPSASSSAGKEDKNKSARDPVAVRDPQPQQKATATQTATATATATTPATSDIRLKR